MKRLPRSLAAVVLGGAASLIGGGAAEASGHGHGGGGGGGVHVSGSVHIGGGVHVSGAVRVRSGFAARVGGPWRRPWFGGSVWVGGFWWPRVYYYYPYYPEYVPSYYGQPYYPVQPMAAPGVVAVRPHRQPLPRLGIGVFAGATDVNHNEESTDLGLLARFRMTPGLLIGAEVGKTSFKDNERVDRRIEGELIWEIGAHNSLAPYLLGGGGVEQANVDGSFNTTLEFGEVGVGLRLALSRNLHLTADVRAGERKTIDTNQPRFTPLTSSIEPPSGVNGNDTENYVRGQLAAVLMF